MGLDPQKGFAEMYEDNSMKDTVGVEVEVLDAVVPHEPLEEVTRLISGARLPLLDFLGSGKIQEHLKTHSTR
jgi:hypothetical protein